MKTGLIILLVLGATLFVGLMPSVQKELEVAPVSYENNPFPTTNPVFAGDSLGTTVQRCNSTSQIIVTNVARRLVNETTGEITTLQGNPGIVPPGCTEQTGGIGLPAICTEQSQKGCVRLGDVYHVEQFISVPGVHKTHLVLTQTQPFRVVGR